MPAESEFLGLEDLEQEKLEQVVAIIKACRYTILNKSEWEAANSEDFLVRRVEDDRCMGQAWHGGHCSVSAIGQVNRCPPHGPAPPHVPHPTHTADAPGNGQLGCAGLDAPGQVLEGPPRGAGAGRGRVRGSRPHLPPRLQDCAHGGILLRSQDRRAAFLFCAAARVGIPAPARKDGKGARRGVGGDLYAHTLEGVSCQCPERLKIVHLSTPAHLPAFQVDMERFFAAPPPGMESVDDDLDPYAASTTAEAHADFKKGRLHQNTVSIERRTLARWEGGGCARSFLFC